MEGWMMFRFTIRELLILTFAAGLGTGWWSDHKAQAKALVFAEEKAKLLESILNPRPDAYRCGTIENMFGSREP